MLDKSGKDLKIIAFVLNDLLDFAILILTKFINTNKHWNAIVESFHYSGKKILKICVN